MGRPYTSALTHPRNLSQLAWYYEQKEGLVVCQQSEKGKDATIVTIPWRRVESALKRHHRAKNAE